jgi:MSHA biogenesis protein MshQ
MYIKLKRLLVLLIVGFIQSPAYAAVCSQVFPANKSTIASTGVTFSPGIFQAAPGGSPNLTIAANNTGTAGSSGQVNYNTITVNGGAKINFNSQGLNTVYKINNLILKNNSIVNLVSGTYWINTLSANNNVTFNVVGAGTAKIYINNSVTTGNSFYVNQGTIISDPAHKILMYTYNAFNIGSNSIFVGFLYVNTAFTFRSNSFFTGSVTAGSLALHANTTFTYTPNAIPLTDFGGSCTNAPTGITGFIMTYDTSTGSSCFRKAITVTAKNGSSIATTFNQSINLTTTTNGGDWSLITGNGTFIAGTSNSGTATYTYSTSDLGVAVFGLTYRNGAGTVTAHAKLQSFPSITDNGTQGSMTLTEANLLLTSSPVSGILSSLPTAFSSIATAGVSDTLYLTAYGLKSAGVCGVITGYTGNKALKFWSTYVNPNTGSLAYSVNSNNIATTQAAATNQTISFVSGAASIPILYRDVGKMQISVKDSAFPCVICSGTYTAIASTANFVVKPAKFGISAVGNPGAVDSNGAVFTQAGENFTINVTAQDFAGNTTPNYGNETVAQGINIYSSSLIAPVGGSNGSANNGAIANASSFSKIAPGVFQNTIASFDEVGIIKITAEVLGQNYLSAGNVATQSSNVGRFNPYNFSATGNTPVFTTANGSSGFTYVGQNFGYTTHPSISVTAKGKSGNTTQNYTGSFFKITTASIIPSYSTNNVGTTLSSAAAALDFNVIDNGSGTGSILFNNGGGLALPKVNGTNLVPFVAEIKLAVTVADTDAREYSSNPFKFGEITANNGIAFDYGKQFYSGRMAINNGYGSELLPINMNIDLQYFNTNSIWTTNTLDNFTSFNNINNLIVSADNASLNTTPSLGSISNGIIPLTLSAPGDGIVGNVSVEANISATGANIPYLQYDWPYDANNDGVENDNPRGIGSFGVYKGKDFIIYTREVY